MPALCPFAYFYGLDWYNCGLREGVACTKATANNYKQCKIWRREKPEEG